MHLRFGPSGYRNSPLGKKSTDVNIWKRKWWNYHAYVVYESNTDNLLTCPPPPLRVSHGFSLWLSYEASNLKTIIQMIAACLLWLLLLLSAHDFPHHPRISDIKMWAAIWRPSKVPQATERSDPTACELHHTAIENPPDTLMNIFYQKFLLPCLLLPGYYCSLAYNFFCSGVKSLLVKRSVSDSWWFVTYYQKQAL